MRTETVRQTAEPDDVSVICRVSVTGLDLGKNSSEAGGPDCQEAVGAQGTPSTALGYRYEVQQVPLLLTRMHHDSRGAKRTEKEMGPLGLLHFCSLGMLWETTSLTREQCAQ